MIISLAIIADENKILIGKLKKEKLEEYGGIQYVFPSAQTETEKNIQNEIVKEVKMQANLSVVSIKRIGKRIHPITRNLTQYYFCEVKDGQINISHEADIEKFMWVSKSVLHTYMPSLFDTVKKYLQIF